MDIIDRLAPTVEPEGTAVGKQTWNHLGFFHWEIPASHIQKHIPPQLTVDTYQGKAYVSLIPFRATGTRPSLLPAVPFFSDFDELNLRTYVHLNGHEPGVWFFSLDASSVAAVAAARTGYKLPFFHADIQMVVSDDRLPTVTFRSRRITEASTNAHCNVTYAPDEIATIAKPESLEFFLVERYVLYTADNGGVYRARVHHEPYRIHSATVSELKETVLLSSGIKRSEARPIAHYARMVDISIYPLEKVA